MVTSLLLLLIKLIWFSNKIVRDTSEFPIHKIFFWSLNRKSSKNRFSLESPICTIFKSEHISVLKIHCVKPVLLIRNSSTDKTSSTIPLRKFVRKLCTYPSARSTRNFQNHEFFTKRSKSKVWRGSDFWEFSAENIFKPRKEIKISRFQILHLET